jgi:DNA-binding NtrC family response regulator
MANILVVDDEAALRAALSALLETAGHTVRLADRGEAALDAYRQRPADVVILDLTLPGINGVQTLEKLLAIDRQAVAIFLTAFGTIRTAVDAIRAGGFDFLEKPFDNDELLIVIDRALRFRHLDGQVRRLEEDLASQSAFPGIVGRSEALRAALRLLARVSALDTTVLLLGESGTGKELVARNLHEQSPRAGGPFVALNCGAIPATLAEAELFGYERGAFTDARDSRAGKFEHADGGTLFLDEIGELPAETQTKLLRVLQEREVTRLGGRKPVPVDVRIVAATNRDLHQAVDQGRFRSDLFYRINAFAIELPPLRDRAGDVPLLTRYLLERISQRLGLAVPKVSPAAMAQLESHTWPGNIRELENVLQRAVIMTDGGVINAFPLSSPGASLPAISPDARLDDVVAQATARIERAMIQASLREHGGNRSRTATALGISRRTLFTKMKTHGLTGPGETDES